MHNTLSLTTAPKQGGDILVYHFCVVRCRRWFNNESLWQFACIFRFLVTSCMHSFTHRDQQQTRAVLVNKFLPIDVTKALEEGQRSECVGVSYLHKAGHCLDQSHEALQLRGNIIWEEGDMKHTHKITQTYKKSLWMNPKKDFGSISRLSSVLRYPALTANITNDTKLVCHHMHVSSCVTIFVIRATAE